MKTVMQRTVDALLKAKVITQEVADGLVESEKQSLIEACAFGYGKGYLKGVDRIEIEPGELMMVGNEFYNLKINEL